MTASHDLERRLNDHFQREAPPQAPDRVLAAALATIDSTPQRRASRVPWRTYAMPTALKLAIGVGALVLAFASGGLLLLPRPSVNVAGPGSSSPSPGPSSTAAPTPVDTSSWLPFTSARNGYTMSYPPDWTVRAATKPWLVGDPGDPDQPGSPAVDEFRPPSGPAVFIVTSQALPAGVDGDTWFGQNVETPPYSTCFPAPAEMEPISVDGRPGKLNGSLPTCQFTNVTVIVDGRAYFLTVFPNGWGGANAVFDRPLFDALLSTVAFDPAAADDTPLATPTPRTSTSPSASPGAS